MRRRFTIVIEETFNIQVRSALGLSKVQHLFGSDFSVYTILPTSILTQQQQVSTLQNCEIVIDRSSPLAHATKQDKSKKYIMDRYLFVQTNQIPIQSCSS